MANPFRIYYGDGEVYDGDPFQAPGANVQYLVVKMPDGAIRNIALKDCYMWREDCGGWVGGDWLGMVLYFATYKGPQKVLLGMTIADSSYQAIAKQAAKEAGTW